MMHYGNHPGRQAGFNLIEVLVALVVLAIGLLGLASLQASSLKFNHSAYMRTQAINLAYDMSDRIRANRSAALSGGYELGLGDGPPGAGSIASQDLTEWLNALNALLPSGDGAVCRTSSNAPTGLGSCDGSGDVFVIVVQWDDSRGADSDDARAAEETTQFMLVTGL